MIFDLQDVGLHGIDIDTKYGNLFLLNVYLPYQSPDNNDEFCNYLGKNCFSNRGKNTSNIVITNDFNAGVNTSFEAELIDMCDTIDPNVCLSVSTEAQTFSRWNEVFLSSVSLVGSILEQGVTRWTLVFAGCGPAKPTFFS